FRKLASNRFGGGTSCTTARGSRGGGPRGRSAWRCSAPAPCLFGDREARDHSRDMVRNILATWRERRNLDTASPLRAVPSIVAHSRSLDIPSESRGARMRSPPRGRFLKRTFDKIKRTFKMNEWTGGNRHAARARRRATTRLPAADRRVASVEASRAAARRATR